MRYVLILGLLVLFSMSAPAIVTYVPDDYSTIQNAVDNSNDNDTIIIKPGVYLESVVLSSTGMVISSLYLLTGDTSYISSTIIDGNGALFVFKVSSNSSDNSIIGLSIRNGEDGIIPYSELNVSHNYIYNCVDAIDYENNSGGICEYNQIYNNSDDAIDLDDAVSIEIRNNILRDNIDDGIEIRFQAYTGELLNILIFDNEIYGNGEDGIQIIGDAFTTNRTLHIAKNLIYDNSMAGIGSMANMNTIENYLGSNIVEDIYISNNTISNNNYGITGSDNMLVINNIIINNTEKGVSNVGGNSLVTYCNFWNNVDDTSNIIVDQNTCIFNTPELDANYYPGINSLIIDKGINSYTHNLLSFIYEGNYSGVSVDMGAKEFGDSTTSIPKMIDNNGVVIELYPNPTTDFIVVSLNDNISYYCEVYSLSGKLIHSISMNVNTCKLDLSFIESGDYILVVRLKNGKIYNKKFIKN